VYQRYLRIAFTENIDGIAKATRCRVRCRVPRKKENDIEILGFSGIFIDIRKFLRTVDWCRVDGEGISVVIG